MPNSSLLMKYIDSINISGDCDNNVNTMRFAERKWVLGRIQRGSNAGVECLSNKQTMMLFLRFFLFDH